MNTPQGKPLTEDMRSLYMWLDERMQQIASNHLEAHSRIRNDMNAGFAEIRTQFADVFKQARAISDRTLTIEVERSMERRQGIKVGVIYGSIAGAATSALIAGIFRALGV